MAGAPTNRDRKRPRIDADSLSCSTTSSVDKTESCLQSASTSGAERHQLRQTREGIVAQKTQIEQEREHIIECRQHLESQYSDLEVFEGALVDDSSDPAAFLQDLQCTIKSIREQEASLAEKLADLEEDYSRTFSGGQATTPDSQVGGAERQQLQDLQARRQLLEERLASMAIDRPGPSTRKKSSKRRRDESYERVLSWLNGYCAEQAPPALEVPHGAVDAAALA